MPYLASWFIDKDFFVIVQTTYQEVSAIDWRFSFVYMHACMYDPDAVLLGLVSSW